MMRYENAELEIVKFLATDVIATSSGSVGGGGMGGPNEGEEDEL